MDFAARQKQEAASVPEDQKTEAQRRQALIPLPVYVEEVVQYNVFSAVGPKWDRLLGDIDDWKSGKLAARTSAGYVFFRPDEEPIREVLDKLAQGGGMTYVSISRPGEDRHYQVDRRTWTRRDFRPGEGFTGKPAPPARFLYAFRSASLGLVLGGIALFALLPGPRRPGARRGLTVLETAALAGGLLLFALPLVAVGGSVQALTRVPWLTIPCWLLAAVCVHVFAGPGRDGTLILRERLAFLALALGPLAFLVSASMTLWNR